MSAPSLDRHVRHRSRRADAEGAASGSPPASAIESPAVRAILEQAAEEAARLLGADGTFLYLLVPGTNRLRLTHDAGIQNLAELPWVRRLEVEVGRGLFGKAVAERRVMLTGDYPDDTSFVHAPGPDRIVREVGIRSLVVAPMVAGDEVYGAIGTFSRERDAFTAPQIALVRSLADHAAQAIANARLIEELDRSRTALSRRAELEKALREIGARISAASDPAEVVQRAVDEALRLIGGEGARIDLVDPRINLLRGSYTGGAEPPTPEQWPDDPDETLDEGVSGKVVTEGVTFWTGDYLNDTRFKHAKGPDTFARATGIRSAIAAPLVAEHGPFGALTVWSRQPDAFGPDEAGVLETIAGQAAVALGRARLIEQLDRSRDELARRADEERTLREIAARLSEIRDPSEVLQRIVGEVRRLLGAERCRLDLAEPVTGRLLWSDPVDMVLHDRAAIPLGDPSKAKGLTAIAIREHRALVSEAYLDDDRFEHYPEADREARELGLTSIVVVPVIGESGLLGVLQAAHQRRAAFGDDEVRLVEALASHAAIAIMNARLIDRLEQSQAALARTADAERALREIAARVTVLHEPAQVLESIIAEAPRLVAADWALIDIVEPTGGRTQWTWPPGQGESGRSTAGIAAVRAGKQARRGLSSRAIVERRAVITGNYLADRSFRHDPTSDAYARSIGMSSVIAAPMFGDGGLLGMLQVGSRRSDAFGPEDAARIEVLANEAAIAVTNARLIEELARSREALARTAEAERSLREMAGRLTAIRDPKELLADVTRDAARLLGSNAALIDLLDLETDTFAWGFDVGVDSGLRTRWYEAGLGDPASRLAMHTRSAVITGDYRADPRFGAEAHAAFLDEIGLRSLLVVPMVGDEGPLGTLSVLSSEIGRFDEDDAALLQSLADQAAIAVTNARLVEQLARSREALAKTADVERALRELTGRLTVIRDPKELLADVTREAARLLSAESAVIDLVDDGAGRLRWGHGVGITREQRDEWYRRGLTDAASELAIARREPVITGDYARDERFGAAAHAEFIASIGIRSMLVVPLGGDGGVLGTLAVVSPREGAFGAEDAAVLQSLADQAAIAVTNARLIEELASSREALRRTADAERTLREIVAELTTIGEPREVLQRIVDAAKRLAGSDMSFLHLLDPATGRLRFEVADQGVEDVTMLDATTDVRDVEEGISGLAVRMRRAVRTRDYLSDERFIHSPSGDALARAKGHKAAIATPLLAEGMVLGVLSVVATDADRFDETVERQLSALADQAAIAIRNAELIRALGQSREETARRAETERTLREIAARITAIRDPQGILELIVEEARRVLGSDGAHLTRLADDERVLRPVVVAGAEDPETAIWIKGLEFPVDGGINGLAASLGRVVWTPDYAMDPRIPRDPSDLAVAERLRLGAMAAAPLRAPGGEVIGTLAVNYAAPGPIPGDRLEVLQALADHAAIALSNSDLYTRLEASEREFRGLVQASPDVIWRNDAEGRFTFIADSAEQLFGWRADELIGQSYALVVAERDQPQALAAWEELRAAPDASWRIRIQLRRRDGSEFPAEVSAVAFWEDGVFSGAQGTLRDISDRERLERELRESEERYRFLVENSPDIIFSTDEQGRLTYVSETIERALGYRPEQLLGRPFAEISEGVPGEERGRRFAEMAADPSKEMVFRYLLVHADGQPIPFEVSARGLVRDGRFAGVYGAARDMTERERLERELRESEGRYRFLVQSSPDMVWVTDADGRFTFVSDTTAQILGWSPDELVGRTFDDLAPAHVRRRARTLFRYLARRPNEAHRSRLPVMTRDGRELTMEISGIAMLVDGRFAGAHGAARDVSERDRLERDLRRQAAELASSEERSHLARELHDSVTQALFSMTLLSRSIEMLLTKDPAQVPAKLAALRDLQRDALAEMRALIFELRPGNVAENGLIGALRTHVAGLSGRIGLPVVLEGELPERPSLEVEDTLYRIAQEALHNVVKHAGAREVRIEIEQQPDAVRLVVRDDGRGFDPERVPAGHLGLAGMRARAEKLGGRITVTSEPGRGTVVECVVPTSAMSAPPGDVQAG
ncbi:MAG TPA: GAF domain-containing protein [Candidatus Limnocylindrales bacterium]|nr:GAF domain-containing protein [Candidatus Limnocylindrales bacterium]